MRKPFAGSLLIVCLSLLSSSPCSAQTDSISHAPTIEKDTIVCPCNRHQQIHKKNTYRVKPLQVIVPSTFIAVGIIGLESDWLKYQNKEVRDELQERHRKKKTVDNYLQYAPLVSTYGLKLCGVKSKHNYGELTIITATAYALMGISVNTMKSITKIERPDGSTRNSFPSGHTATAFMGAELLRREYWDVSPWIGVAGYAAAFGTGFLRMYNNRHWLTDVIAGAGFGILSTEAAYWLYPAISRTFFHRKQHHANTFVSPYISQESKGLSCAITF